MRILLTIIIERGTAIWFAGKKSVLLYHRSKCTFSIHVKCFLCYAIFFEGNIGLCIYICFLEIAVHITRNHKG